MLSVVMPAHNEAELLESSVRAVLLGARELDDSVEVLVIENGSTDATPAIAGRLAHELAEVQATSLPSPDYGQALQAGLLAARGDVVVTFDVDYYDLGFLMESRSLLHGAEPAPDIVLASKRATGAQDTRAFRRRVVTATFSTMLRLGFGLQVSDTHGMKVMRRAVVQPIARACQFGTDLFDTELVLRAERAGVAITEIPVRVEERRPSRTPMWRRVPRTLVGLVRLRVALFRGRL